MTGEPLPDYLVDALQGMDPTEAAYMARTMKTLHEDPKTRGQLLGLVKQKFPNVRIPDIDVPNEVLTALQEALKEIRSERDALRKERAQEHDARERTRILARHELGLSDEDLPAIAELMEKRGISSFETAAEFRSHSKKAAAPRSVAPQPFTMPPDDTKYVQRLLKGDKRAHIDKAYQVLDELAQARR